MRRPSPAVMLRRVLPWAVALGILWVLFRRVGGPKVWDAIGDAELAYLIGVTILYTLPMYALDVVTLRYVFSRFNCPVAWREIAALQAASYLLKVLNFNAGTGAAALWLNRRKRVPFLEAASSVLFINVTDTLVLATFMATGLPAIEPPMQTAVATIVIIAGAGFAGHLLYWRGGVNFLLLGRFREWSLFKSFREAEIRRYAVLAAVRAPFILCFIANQWLGMRAFQIDVPFSKMVIFIPVLSFIAIVPVTVAGLGTVQAATLFLFRPYAAEPQLLAASLGLVFVLNGVRVLIGLPTFGRVSRELVQGADGRER